MQYPKLFTYADSYYAADRTRRSRSGFIILLGKYPIIWSSKLQRCVALSSTEAEYVAVTAAARFTIWARAFLEEMGFSQESPTTIFEDNKGCIDISTSTKSHPAVKHIDVRHHFIRERIQDIKDLKLEKVSTVHMLADLFTKQLPAPVFVRHRQNLGLTDQC
jgi:hypothetical protein